jgi:hypothetical protein
MAYGSVLTDVVQSSVTGTPPQFNDGAGTQTGTLCRAWVNYQGGNGNTSGTINASFNVSSVTANGTGDWTINYTTAMPNANYVVVGNALESTADGNLTSNRSVNPRRTALLTTSTRIGCVYYDGTAVTVNSVFIAIFR